MSNYTVWAVCHSLLRSLSPSKARTGKRKRERGGWGRLQAAPRVCARQLMYSLWRLMLWHLNGDGINYLVGLVIFARKTYNRERRTASLWDHV